MTSFRIRPRFKHLSPIPKNEIERMINQALSEKDAICVGESLPGHVNLKIPLKDRHFWSPQLTITLDENEEGTIIRGLYGPNPTVWAIFFFGYVTIGVAIFFLAMLGFTRMSLGLSYGALWIIPGLLALGVILYFSAQMGQKLGAEQMFSLHHFYEELIHDKISIT